MKGIVAVLVVLGLLTVSVVAGDLGNPAVMMAAADKVVSSAPVPDADVVPTPVAGGTIPNAASVGVDLKTTKTEWQKTKEHFKNNWGKYLLGIGSSATVGLVGVNNDWFQKDEKSAVPIQNTSTLHDEGITVVVTGNSNTIHVDRTSHNTEAKAKRK
jgi:hypothetical protein